MARKSVLFWQWSRCFCKTARGVCHFLQEFNEILLIYQSTQFLFIKRHLIFSAISLVSKQCKCSWSNPTLFQDFSISVSFKINSPLVIQYYEPRRR